MVLVTAGRVVAWVARFPNARVLTVGKLKRGIPPALAVRAAAAAGGLRKLEALSLRDCRFRDEGVAALAAALTAASAAAPLTIVELDLCGTGIGDTGAAA